MSSKMKFVVRDSNNPCKPYASTGHSFFAAVFNCDKTVHAVVPMTGAGPRGGKIYGTAKVPSGTYIVVGLATCKNVWTNTALVVVGCEQDVCVNLIPRRFEQCVGELKWAVVAALNATGKYSFSSPEREVAPEIRDILEETDGCLGRLARHFDPFDPQLSDRDLARAKAPEELVDLWNRMQERES